MTAVKPRLAGRIKETDRRSESTWTSSYRWTAKQGRTAGPVYLRGHSYNRMIFSSTPTERSSSCLHPPPCATTTKPFLFRFFFVASSSPSLSSLFSSFSFHHQRPLPQYISICLCTCISRAPLPLVFSLCFIRRLFVLLFEFVA